MEKLIKGLFTGAVALGGLYALSVQGRTGHPGLESLRGWKYAHRGLHDDALPENSMAAFRAALEAGYGIELDIHLMKDGQLAVIHDTSLKRTAGADVKITDLTAEDLENYPLGGTEEKIPLFSQVLELFAGKAPLIIELKSDGNAAELVAAAVKIMEGYDGPFCMESFDPRVVYELKKQAPHIIRGQLTMDYFKEEKSPLHPALKWLLTNQAENFLTMPDFVSYRYCDCKTFSNTLARRFWGIQGVTWTLKTQAELDEAVSAGWLPIFEGFKP
ncbi:MAG: glycerophosphodiester phosphodiesterase [Ruminococcaceae bacterium]|nr:glycerophosphodiester phosphodiesterase [Oscillospiraceae bacterium]